MAYKVKKICRVCSKEYIPCADCENDNTAFHWRTVACSFECGKEYFNRVLEARQEPVFQQIKKKSSDLINNNDSASNKTKTMEPQKRTKKKESSNICD